jgi:parallel beta-helix repeat protein
MPTESSRRDVLSHVFGAGATLAGAALIASEPARAQGTGSYPPYNVLFVANFGAVGNGTTDDTAAIQSAINALGNNGVLQFQAGKTYAVSGTGLLISGLTNACIDFNNCGIKALANSLQVTGNYLTCVRLKNCIRCVIKHGSFDGGGYSGAFIGLDTCTDTLVLGNVSTNAAGGGGQFVSIAGLRNIWESNEALNSAASPIRGFWLGGTNAGQGETDLIVRFNKAIRNGATGFSVGGDGLQVIGNFAAQNGWSGGGAGINCGGGTNHVVMGNVSRENGFHGYQTDNAGGTLVGCVLSGNLFYGNTHSGIYVANGINFAISGNVVSGNATGGTFDPEIDILNCQAVSITGNTISMPASAINTAIGVGLPSVCADVAIVGNVVRNASNSGWGILLYAQGPASSLQGVTVTGNLLSGGAYGIYVRVNDPAGVLGSVNISGNDIANAATTALLVAAATAGQIFDLRLIGNTGSPFSIDANTTPVANHGNTWNQVLQAGYTYGAAVPNCSQGMVQAWTCNANCTFFTPTFAPLPGNTLTLIVTQDSIGGHGVAWNAAYRNPPVWASGAPNSRATAVFVYDGTVWQFVGGSPAFV